MSLKDSNLKLSVNQTESGDNEQIKSTLSDSNESRLTHSGWSHLGPSNTGSNLRTKTMRSCGNDQSLSSSTKTCPRGKSTVAAAGEHKPLNELSKEIRKAEQLLDEYESERREQMAEEAVATANSIRPEDIEGLLKEFSNVDEKNGDSAIASSNAGLNHLMADYFREYYNNLRRKIAQFSRERVALLMVIDNLKSDRSKLQTDVEFLRRKLHKDRICTDEICTVSAAPWNCK